MERASRPSSAGRNCSSKTNFYIHYALHTYVEKKYCLYSSYLVAIEWFELGDLTGTFMEPSQVHHMDNSALYNKSVLFRLDSECLGPNWTLPEPKRCLREHFVCIIFFLG